MKNIILAISIILTLASASFIGVAHTSAAAIFDSCKGTLSDTAVCKDATKTSTGNPIIGAIQTVIEILSIIIGIASVIVIIISGLRMSLANGDSNAIASARSSLLYSLVGLAIAALAQVIVRIVLGSVA